jgi:hypothetical protein
VPLQVAGLLLDPRVGLFQVAAMALEDLIGLPMRSSAPPPAVQGGECLQGTMALGLPRNARRLRLARNINTAVTALWTLWTTHTEVAVTGTVSASRPRLFRQIQLAGILTPAKPSAPRPPKSRPAITIRNR